jgi:hypothetical protein
MPEVSDNSVTYHGRRYRRVNLDNAATQPLNRGVERVMTSNRSMIGKASLRMSRMFTTTRNGNTVKRQAR